MKSTMAIAFLLTVSLITGVAAAPQPTTLMNTMAGGGSIGKKILFPRLTKLPDAKIMTRINAILTKKEVEERQGAVDCVANVKDSGQPASGASYDVTVNVTYLSSRYLSLTDRVEYNCAGAHPDAAASMLTFDLVTGAEIDLMKAFKSDFDFTKIYPTRYRMPKVKGDDADCRGWSTGDAGGLGEMRPYLDAKIGIVISLEAAHVVAACADDLNLSLADVQKYLKDQALLADLKATVKPK